MSEYIKEPYRMKASLFFQGRESDGDFAYDKVLQDFVKETAGFYSWFRREKAELNRLNGATKCQ